MIVNYVRVYTAPWAPSEVRGLLDHEGCVSVAVLRCGQLGADIRRVSVVFATFDHVIRLIGSACCFTDQQDLTAAMRSGTRTGRASRPG